MDSGQGQDPTVSELGSPISSYSKKKKKKATERRKKREREKNHCSQKENNEFHVFHTQQSFTHTTIYFIYKFSYLAAKLQKIKNGE